MYHVKLSKCVEVHDLNGINQSVAPYALPLHIYLYSSPVIKADTCSGRH